MAMQYKTNPQGKPRVYFCCHPKDFELYFESITNEILHIQDCAIWYDLSNAPLDEERQLDLRQMQLFVIPITTKLLITPNVALSEEFPFAIQNHIPVLPIMLEGGLEELFNKKCGDLQFLDKTAHDPTAISYEEKLKKYLSSVLVSDELAAKVRRAFDARIFLSYRRDDRKDAQQLMWLIHQDDLFRDIAIWYDEYLLPGEDFNTTIENMIQRSDLIALAVTPNLFKIPNYALMREYPEAKAAQKTILPVEVISIDPNILKLIPTCVHKGDQQQLSVALLDFLQRQKIVLRKNDSDPQHNFFIGLAYLNGIDVEVNHAMAKKLITGAAEASLPQAIEKLVEMYRAGTGVERDYREAIRWQKKLVELRRADYAREKNEENGHALVLAFWTLGDYAVEAGDVAAAKIAYQQMHEVSLETATSYKTIKSWRDLSASYGNLGNICKAEGNLSQAIEYCQEGLEISRQLAEETDTVDVRPDMLFNYGNLGNIYKVGSNFIQARKHYQKAQELSYQLAEEKGTVQSRQGLSACYGSLGSICWAEGNLAQAREYYQKGLELSRQLVEETGTVESRRDLSISYNNMGTICKSEGNLAQTREYYQKGLELSRQLVEETGAVEFRRDVSISYNRLGDICQAEGDLTGAKEYYQKSLKLRRRLAEETGTVQSRRDLSISYHNLGDICFEAEDNLTQTKEYYQRCFELSRQLAEETDTVRSYKYLALSYCSLALVSAESERRELLAQVDRIYKMLSQKCPEVPEYRHLLDRAKQFLDS